MRRYGFLDKYDIFEAWNNIRSAFLAAKNGEEVDNIIKGILTKDERLKIGRRILISKLLDDNLSYDHIAKHFKVGRQTIIQVQKLKEKYPKCFDLIKNREIKVENEFQTKAIEKFGNPKRVYKLTRYTGFKRKDVTR